MTSYCDSIAFALQVAAAEPPPDECGAFVVVHGKHTCKISEIKKLLNKAKSRYSNTIEKCLVQKRAGIEILIL